MAESVSFAAFASLNKIAGALLRANTLASMLICVSEAWRVLMISLTVVTNKPSTMAAQAVSDTSSISFLLMDSLASNLNIKTTP